MSQNAVLMRLGKAEVGGLVAVRLLSNCWYYILLARGCACRKLIESG